MAKPDPLTPTRRRRFQDYCTDRGWRNENDSWKTGEIGVAIGKPTSKASDLLNATGTFGATIARDIEAALDLPPGYFDFEIDWPFSLIDQKRYWALSPEARGAAQQKMMDAIIEQETRIRVNVKFK